MKRPHLFFSIIGAGLAGLLGINGCISPTVSYQVQQLAQLRVMNFAPNCTAPIDVYWDTKTPQVLGNNAKIYNLQYGESSVYYTSLPAAQGGTVYHFSVTKTRNPSEFDLNDIQGTLLPGNQYTLMITLNPSNSQSFTYSLIQDHNTPNPIPTSAYVRFINMQPNIGPLSVHVNDPVLGTNITPTPIQYNSVGPYVALNTAQDTSFAFFVTNSNNQVLARLSYQTFTGGSFYTLIYAGDPCSTLANNPADTSISALDTFRLRAFDDNSTGNDQTNPIQYSFRYNIINAIYPTVLPYDQNNHPPVDTLMGLLVNGDGFPEHAGYSINPVPPLSPAGASVKLNTSDSTYSVNYQSAILANPLDVKGFITNATGTSQRQVFDYSLSSPGSIITQDKPVTILLTGPADTASPNLKPFWQVTGKVFQVPDTNYVDSVTFVFFNGLSPSPKVFTNQLNTYFFVSQNGGAPVPPLFNGLSTTRSAPVIMRFGASAGTNFVISDKIGTGSNEVDGPPHGFTAQAGGIYEVLSTGIKPDSHILIMQLNAQ